MFYLEQDLKYWQGCLLFGDRGEKVYTESERCVKVSVMK